MPTPWMIYGANGYTGELIAREAARLGMKPTLAGRSIAKLDPLAATLGLPFKAFALDDQASIQHGIDGMGLVLHCAGPFSSTAAPMMAACLKQRAHYLDITGEIDVFEHAQSLDKSARATGIIICPGVGFDVIPTDCIAARLKEALPDATHLALGFDSRSGFSPGTAKTSIEGLGLGGKVRINGQIKSVPLAYKTRRINFGDGEKLAMTIPWGDVSTAFATTQIPNIECYIPGSPRMIANAKRANWLRWLLRLRPVQTLLKRRIEKTVQGPSETTRQAAETYVWGEATNARGDTKTARIRTANGYALTVTGALAIVDHIRSNEIQGGFYTPSKLAGPDLISRLPGSGPMVIS